jgi:phosphoesterase RecJ-like protein
MPNFTKDFHTLNYVIKESDSILLFAHSHPDSDTTGANVALKEYINSLGKKVDIACFDPFPPYLRPLTDEVFSFPDQLDISSYKLIIASDSVERGFQRIREKIGPDQIVALIDHHPDITPDGDINIIDPNYSSVCEMVYDFFIAEKIKITRPMATGLMLGILGDTGMFQHSNTTPRVLDISAKLMQLGAPLSRIAEVTFGAKKVCTLKLWGRAFEKAKFIEKNGMIFSVLTKNDLAECEATGEDISQVAGILNTVPGTKFSLILSEREGGVVKGSLRSEEYKGVDVSRIAAQFGGGGHKLASGFEMKGKVVETEGGWKVV